jgi:hypothetical protein
VGVAQRVEVSAKHEPLGLDTVAPLGPAFPSATSSVMKWRTLPSAQGKRRMNRLGDPEHTCLSLSPELPLGPGSSSS